MRLDPFTRDYRVFMAQFSEALETEGTLFYLDTSLLMWLLRISPMARAEFIKWCKECPKNAVRVPVWAAHELHRHLVGGTVRSSVRKTLLDAASTYRQFATLASERADDSICLAHGYPGRNSYVSSVEQSLAQLTRLERVVELDDAQIRRAAEEVIELVNAHVLESDIDRVITGLSLTGDFRSSHRVPPGFADNGKNENRFGDLIIWEEIVADLLASGSNASGSPRSAVLVSRDQKTDWVSTAPFVINLRGAAQSTDRDRELDVTLANPLLVHEFVLRARGNQIYITTPGFLASVLDFLTRKHGREYDVSQWLAASHRSDVLDHLAAKKLDNLPLAPLGVEPKFETEDAVGVMAESVESEASQYLQADALEQASLLRGWVAGLTGGGLSPTKFGRIVADLSIRGTPDWPEQLLALIELASAMDRRSLNELVLAASTSAYFDPFGQLLRRPHAKLAQTVLQLEGDARFKAAFVALGRFLSHAGANLPFLPGSGHKAIPFELDLVPGTIPILRDIRIAEYSALAYPVSLNSQRRLSTFLGRAPAAGCTGLEIRMLCSREFLVPESLLSHQGDKKNITWRSDAGLVLLDTGIEGGLSALTDEEDKNE